MTNIANVHQNFNKKPTLIRVSIFINDDVAKQTRPITREYPTGREFFSELFPKHNNQPSHITFFSIFVFPDDSETVGLFAPWEVADSIETCILPLIVHEELDSLSEILLDCDVEHIVSTSLRHTPSKPEYFVYIPLHTSVILRHLAVSWNHIGRQLGLNNPSIDALFGLRPLPSCPPEYQSSAFSMYQAGQPLKGTVLSGEDAQKKMMGLL